MSNNGQGKKERYFCVLTTNNGSIALQEEDANLVAIEWVIQLNRRYKSQQIKTAQEALKSLTVTLSIKISFSSLIKIIIQMSIFLNILFYLQNVFYSRFFSIFYYLYLQNVFYWNIPIFLNTLYHLSTKCLLLKYPNFSQYFSSFIIYKCLLLKYHYFISFIYKCLLLLKYPNFSQYIIPFCNFFFNWILSSPKSLPTAPNSTPPRTRSTISQRRSTKTVKRRWRKVFSTSETATKWKWK